MTDVYAAPLATARRLIAKYGKAGTLIREHATVTDAAKPWKPDPNDPDDSVTAAVTVVTFPYDKKYVNGDTIRSTDLQAYMAPVDGFTPQQGDYLDTGGQRLKVVAADPLQPGDTTVMFTLQLRL